MKTEFLQNGDFILTKYFSPLFFSLFEKMLNTLSQGDIPVLH